MKITNEEQLDLLFEYIESRIHTFVKGLPPDVTIGLNKREKEIKEKLYGQTVETSAISRFLFKEGRSDNWVY